MKINIQIYDASFKRMCYVCVSFLIQFINYVFKENYDIHTPVEFLNTDMDDLEKDIYFKIKNTYYQIEAQTYLDDMMFRCIKYASASNEGYKKKDSSHATFILPKQTVVFLKGRNKNKDKLFIELILPDKHIVEYSIPVIQSLGYTIDELLENHLELLLPFQILQLWNRAKRFNKMKEKGKNQFIHDYKEMIEKLVITLDELLEKNSMDYTQYSTMLSIIKDLDEHVYSNIDTKGANNMLQEKFLFSDQKTEIRVKENTKCEVAEKMIMEKEPIDKIERYSGLAYDKLKEIASKLGTTLVL